MRIINYKLYLLMNLVIELLIFLSFKNKKKNVNNKEVNQVKYFLYVIPILWLLLFIYMNVIFITKKADIYFVDTIIISFFASIIMLLAVQLMRSIILFIRNKSLSTKYGGKKLTDKEVDYINNKYKRSSILWNYILAFIICGVIYSIIGYYIFIESKLTDTIVTALFSTTCYWAISQKNIYK